MIFLHDSEIVSHGHLKPSNCLVDSRWVLQVSDFGLYDLKYTVADLLPPTSVSEADIDDYYSSESVKFTEGVCSCDGKLDMNSSCDEIAQISNMPAITYQLDAFNLLAYPPHRIIIHIICDTVGILRLLSPRGEHDCPMIIRHWLYSASPFHLLRVVIMLVTKVLGLITIIIILTEIIYVKLRS